MCMKYYLVVGIAVVAVILLMMQYCKQEKFDVRNFHELIGKLGDPVKIESALQELLPQALQLSDNSTYVQMLSQIALMQAVQKKFEQAHATLAIAQAACKSDDYQGLAGLTLEQGRVWQQQGDLVQAATYFHASYELSLAHNLDYHTINAAHMIAIIVPSVSDKIAWNLKALDLAEQTQDAKAHSWLAPLYNNLGQNYFDVHEYQKSLEHYQKALQLFEQDKKYSNTLFAQWTIGRCLRALQNYDQALILQQQLLSKMQKMAEQEKYGMPEEMFFLVFGFVYEELAEIYAAQGDVSKSDDYARLALRYLESNEMFMTTSPERIERLHEHIWIKN